MPDPTPVRFENSQPILRVANMQTSLDFYVNKLGFKNVQWGNEYFTSINRDRAGIYLSKASQGRGAAWLWIGVEDVEKLHDELKTQGVPIRMPPTNFHWALEMHVEDPDGNVIRFGSDTLSTVPIATEFPV
jgi:catechol 2,3-dioxygenase-like lactoylglutathione lyase family enzyme